jgi:malonyl-CoA O-methyltransferase
LDEVDKVRVQAHFSRSLSTYRQAAQVQSAMAAELMAALAEVTPRRDFPRILELGCGDGLLSGHIEEQLRYQQLTLVDIVPDWAACHCRRRNAAFVAGDMEDMPLPDADLVMAGAALQWARDLPALLRRISAVLAPAGLLAFSTFGPENLREIKALTGRALVYPSMSELIAMLEMAGYAVLCARERLSVLTFPAPLAVLRHLRETGVNGVKTERPWTRQDLRNFTERYQGQFSLADGQLPLTYHPLWIVAQKRRDDDGSTAGGVAPGTKELCV